VAATLFDIAAEKLEGATGMDRLESRGTLRIAVKEAGLDAQKLTMPQLRAVFEKLMPKELEARGVGEATAICKAVVDDIASAASEADSTAANSPDEVFKRLGGS
jgi:nitrogen fixation/metabolism regulation signal transduction histidine kinase